MVGSASAEVQLIGDAPPRPERVHVVALDFEDEVLARERRLRLVRRLARDAEISAEQSGPGVGLVDGEESKRPRRRATSRRNRRDIASLRAVSPARSWASRLASRTLCGSGSGTNSPFEVVIELDRQAPTVRVGTLGH